jgi:hypothetical protein
MISSFQMYEIIGKIVHGSEKFFTFSSYYKILSNGTIEKED